MVRNCSSNSLMLQSQVQWKDYNQLISYLLQVFVTCELDYCYTILAGCPAKTMKNPPIDPEYCSRSSDRRTYFYCFSFITLAACNVSNSFQDSSHLIQSSKRPIAPSDLKQILIPYYPKGTLSSVLLYCSKKLQGDREAELLVFWMLCSSSSFLFVWDTHSLSVSKAEHKTWPGTKMKGCHILKQILNFLFQYHITGLFT